MFSARATAPRPRAVVAIAALLVGLGASTAGAVPIDEPQIGGIGFSGPTTGDLGAVYWNPAAVGLIRGLRLTVAGTATLGTTSVTRSSIDPTTGAAFSPAETRDRFQPIAWPVGPGGFAGASYDVGGDRFTLAFASYMPFLDRGRYQAADGEVPATRYHRISADLRNLALVSALSIRFAGDLRLGVAPGALFSTGRMSFTESTCAATGCPPGTGDARADLGTGLGIFSSSFAFTLGAGAYYRKRAWEFGASFSSRPLGEVAGSAVITGDSSRVSRPIGVPGGVATCTSGEIQNGECVFRVFADVAYKLPDTIAAAVAWHPRAGWELGVIGRMLIFPDNDAVDIRLTGTALAEAGVPAHIVLHRGYGTVIDTRVRVAAWVNQRLRVGAGLRFEGSALAKGDISPAAVDGRKLQPTAMILFRPVKFLWVGAGYGFTYMFPVTSSGGPFDEGAAAGCAAAGGDLNAANCVQLRQGLARPMADGRYTSVRHDFTLSLSAQF